MFVGYSYDKGGGGGGGAPIYENIYKAKFCLC